MVLIEKSCYQIGRIISNILYVATAPTVIAVSTKCARKFTVLVSNLSLKDKSRAAITENVFKCLDFLE